MAPDETRLVYLSLAEGGPAELRVRDLESREERALGEVLLDPCWSPDGGQILGSDASDRIYLCPAGGGDCRFLAEGFRPQWAPDRRAITFLRADPAAARDPAVRLSIWRWTIATGEGRLLFGVEGAGRLDLGYRVLPEGGAIWNQAQPGLEDLWLAELE